MWDEPSLAYFFHRLARAGRIICFDKRGTGVSDPVSLGALPTLEEWMDDATVVLDAAGSDRAAIIGDTEGGPMAMLLAATSPNRTLALILVNSFARWQRASDYPIGMPPSTVDSLVARYERNWGQDPAILALTAPSVAEDPRMREWFIRYQRLWIPPGAATEMYRWVTRLDVRSVLSCRSRVAAGEMWPGRGGSTGALSGGGRNRARRKSRAAAAGEMWPGRGGSTGA
jgi:pimeloyl-ACP methyl ester carboxylesterase